MRCSYMISFLDPKPWTLYTYMYSSICNAPFSMIALAAETVSLQDQATSVDEGRRPSVSTMD